jgi:CheY-like chemotaxis protein
MEEMLRRTLGPTIEIAIEYPADLPPISVDASQLELALLNLGLNARDAMPQGGQLAIVARAMASGADGPPELAPGRYVCIAVSDTGTGMDEKTVKRATEPFFTTKGAGKGTGLGLSMVHGLAAQSNGAMRLQSRVGEGTRVELWLPVSDEAPTAQAPAPAESFRSERWPSRILVVDDDPLLVASTAAILEDLGHMVIEASSARHALDALRLGANVDVVITDHAMPGMSGTELARQIKQNWPTLPVILASGYGDLPNGEDPGLPRLSKPYRQDDLVAKIAQVVSACSQTSQLPA